MNPSYSHVVIYSPRTHLVPNLENKIENLNCKTYFVSIRLTQRSPLKG